MHCSLACTWSLLIPAIIGIKINTFIAFRLCGGWQLIPHKLVDPGLKHEGNVQMRIHWLSMVEIQGAVSIWRPSYLRMAISMLKIRRPLGRLIFNMGIAIPGKTVFLIETAPRMLCGYLEVICRYIGQHIQLNSSPTWWNGCHFTDIILICILINEKFCILITISLKFDPNSPIVN